MDNPEDYVSKKLTPKDVVVGVAGLFVVSAALTAGSWVGMEVAACALGKMWKVSKKISEKRSKKNS